MAGIVRDTPRGWFGSDELACLGFWSHWFGQPLAKEKSLNELKIERFGDELPGLLILFAQAKTAVSRSVQRQATLISEGQSSGFQFSIKNRLGELLKVIKAL
jgi:hypothetical protein